MLKNKFESKMLTSILVFVSFLSAVLLMTGCSGPQYRPQTSEDTPDKVVSRIDNMSDRPSYVKESQPFVIENGVVTSLGQTTIPGSGHRVEAAYRIAQNNAKAAIAGAIESRLSFVFQQATEGTEIGTDQARFIGAEASELTANYIRPGYIYWEKVATTLDSGSRVAQYRVFATVQVPEADFKRSVMDAARKAAGKGGLSADFAKKVDDHWNNFVNPNQTLSAKEAVSVTPTPTKSEVTNTNVKSESLPFQNMPATENE